MPSKYCMRDSKGDTEFSVIRSLHQIEVLKYIITVVANLLKWKLNLAQAH